MLCYFEIDIMHLSKVERCAAAGGLGSNVLGWPTGKQTNSRVEYGLECTHVPARTHIFTCTNIRRKELSSSNAAKQWPVRVTYATIVINLCTDREFGTSNLWKRSLKSLRMFTFLWIRSLLQQTLLWRRSLEALRKHLPWHKNLSWW